MLIDITFSFVLLWGLHAFSSAPALVCHCVSLVFFSRAAPVHK